MKFSNIMIVTDLDGTFYDSDHNFQPKNMEAVEYFKANGGLFTVASGRVPSSLTGRIEAFAKITNVPAILCNGGFCYDFAKNERFLQIEVDHLKATEIIKAVRESFTVYRTRCSLIGSEVPLGDISETASYEGWTRVSFDDRSYDNLCAIRNMFEDKYSDTFAFMFACPEIFEFQAKTATKGQALDRLRELLIKEGKADASLRVYAVGDFENDLDLLYHADVACCPDNAIDSVKAASKVHLCSCDDGAIADLIERIEKGEA